MKRETARSNELAKGATWELETSKEKMLEKQIAACTLVAPVDGTVVHAGSFRGEEAPPTENRLRLSHIEEEGATVRRAAAHSSHRARSAFIRVRGSVIGWPRSTCTRLVKIANKNARASPLNEEGLTRAKQTSTVMPSECF